MPSKAFRRCKRMLDTMTSSERDRLVSSARPSIARALNEDLLRLICDFLEPHERFAFLSALLYRDGKPRSTHWDHYLALGPLFLREYALQTLVWAVYRAAERLHYILPQNGSAVGMILCNWTPFSSMACRPVAFVSWSRHYPHARVELDMPRMQRVVSSCLASMRPVLRLTAHCTTTHGGVSARVHGHHCQLSLHPTVCQNLFLLDHSGIAVSKLYAKRVRCVIGAADARAAFPFVVRLRPTY